MLFRRRFSHKPTPQQPPALSRRARRALYAFVAAGIVVNLAIINLHYVAGALDAWRLKSDARRLWPLQRPEDQERHHFDDDYAEQAKLVSAAAAQARTRRRASCLAGEASKISHGAFAEKTPLSAVAGREKMASRAEKLPYGVDGAASIVFPATSVETAFFAVDSVDRPGDDEHGPRKRRARVRENVKCAVVAPGQAFSEYQNHDVVVRFDSADVDQAAPSQSVIRIVRPETFPPRPSNDEYLVLAMYKPADAIFLRNAALGRKTLAPPLARGDFAAAAPNVRLRGRQRRRRLAALSPAFFRAARGIVRAGGGEEPSLPFVGVLVALQLCESVGLYGFDTAAHVTPRELGVINELAQNCFVKHM